MFNKIRNWAKNSDTFEVMAIVAIIIGAIIMITSFWLGSVNDIKLKDATANIVDLSEFIGGLVGSLWSLAGVLLFYASLSSQKEDLERQKELLVKQIDEVVAQTKEFRIQNEMAKEQKNEETFFQLLRFHSEIISTITIEQQEVDFVTGENISKNIEGRKAFVEYYDIYKRFFQEAAEMTTSQDEESLSRIFDKAYNSFYLEYQADLGHYFRNLYNIIFFIDSLKKTQHTFYFGLLMAQLSNYELTLLFFHCLRSTSKDFKALVEKYAILDQVPKDEVTTMAHTLYDMSAFGESGFGSGDIIEDDGDFDVEDSLITSEETDSILSRFNLPNMENEPSDINLNTNINSNKPESPLGSMDDILSKLKKISSDKFPEMDGIDDIGNDDFDFNEESPLQKLKDKSTLKKEAIKAEETKVESEELSFEDFFDDDYANDVIDDKVIDIKEIEKIESKGLDNLIKQNIDSQQGEKKLDLDDAFGDLWDNNDSNLDIFDNEEVGLLKVSGDIGSDTEFEELKAKINQDTDEDISNKFEELKSKLDSDMQLDDMLFNKDADIEKEKLNKKSNENKVNESYDEDIDLDAVKNKFNLNFEDLENKSENVSSEFDNYDKIDDVNDDIDEFEDIFDEEEQISKVDTDKIDIEFFDNNNSDNLDDEFGNMFNLEDNEDFDVENTLDNENYDSIKDKFINNLDEIDKENITDEIETVEELDSDSYDLLDDLFDDELAEKENDLLDNNDNVKVDDTIDKTIEEKQNKQSKKLKIKVNKKKNDKGKDGSGFLSKLK